MVGDARALVGWNPLRRTLAAAMILGLMLAATMGREEPTAAQAESSAQRDAVQTQPDGGAVTAASPRSPDASRLLQKAEREGAVRAIVGLRTDFVPEGRLSQSRVDAQRNGIDNARAGLRPDLAGTGYRTLREYETVPYVALALTPRAFRALQNSPHVTSITEDVAVPPALAESTGVINAPTMWNNGFTGAGQTIAVLDTGVDGTHPFLAGKVVEEACYSANSDCPNGEETQMGAGAGVPCTYVPERCEHGTHVAGIAAGQDPGGVGFSGVARGANIMSVQVFSRDGEGGIGTFPSDQLAALERVYQLRSAHNFAAVNMSLGGGRFTEACDSDPLKTIIDNLYSVDIPTVVASGNDGYTDAVSAPACVSSAIAVGATTDADEVRGSSNSSDLSLDFLAPGSSINSSVPGGGFEEKSGTSMAAPHVAGAWAILEQMRPESSILDVHRFFWANGTPVTDNRPGGGVTRTRIDLSDRSTFTVNSTASRSIYGWWQRIETQEGVREVYVDDGCHPNECTLREAINAANASPNFGERDAIEFDIPGSGVQTINLDFPESRLPAITDPVTIDGYTQPEASANTNPLGGGSNAVPLIELTGDFTGLVVDADDSTISGLVINRSAPCCSSFGDAIEIAGDDNVVEGNFLGINAGGNAVGTFTGLGAGVEILTGANNTVIGGTTPAARNVISGNSTNIVLDGGSGTVIQGNYVGTDAAGTAAILLNGGGPGIDFQSSSPNTTIGGAAAGNLISGNGNAGISVRGGVYVAPPSGTIQGNLIGTQRDGRSPLGNRGSGITMDGTNWTIGGLAPGQGNSIAFNGASGISVSGPNNANSFGDRNNISGNSIHSNAGLGIDLYEGNSGGPTLNDGWRRDSDVGPNEEQDYPVLTSVRIAAGVVTVSGTLVSIPNTTFRLEFFANAACDPSGYGEGQTYIGTANVRTDSDGNASFGLLDFLAPFGRSVITATATDPDGNTSEFSRCFVNSPPAAAADSFATDEDTQLTVDAPGVLANDTDPNNDPLSAVEVSDPAHGTLTLNANGSFAYTPNAGFSGTDTFTYRTNDGAADSNTATVTITVNPANDPPAANDDSYALAKGNTLSVPAASGVLANDSDPNGDRLTARLVTGPSTGTLTLNPDGSFAYTKPKRGFNGVTFVYEAGDGNGGTDRATATIRSKGR